MAEHQPSVRRVKVPLYLPAKRAHTLSEGFRFLKPPLTPNVESHLEPWQQAAAIIIAEQHTLNSGWLPPFGCIRVAQVLESSSLVGYVEGVRQGAKSGTTDTCMACSICPGQGVM